VGLGKKSQKSPKLRKKGKKRVRHNATLKEGKSRGDDQKKRPNNNGFLVLHLEAPSQ